MLTIQLAQLVRVGHALAWQLEDGTRTEVLSVQAPSAADAKRAAVAICPPVAPFGTPRIHTVATSDEDGLWRALACPHQPVPVLLLDARIARPGTVVVVASREACDGPIPALTPLHSWSNATWGQA